MAKKYYGVKNGVIPGVYTNWSDAKEQIDGFSGAVFKGFLTEKEAIDFVNRKVINKDYNKNNTLEITTNKLKVDYDIYTDGSYMNNKVGFGIVIVKKGNILIKDCGRFIGSPEDLSAQNVAGELSAIIRAIQLIRANELDNICFKYDYEGVSKWILGEWKAKTPLTKRYVEYFNKQMVGIKYEFSHIYAHTGDKFNEEADRLAKLGTSL